MSVLGRGGAERSASTIRPVEMRRLSTSLFFFARVQRPFPMLSPARFTTTSAAAIASPASPHASPPLHDELRIARQDSYRVVPRQVVDQRSPDEPRAACDDDSQS